MMSTDDNETNPDDAPQRQEWQEARPAISRRAALRRLRLLTGGAAILVAAEVGGATLWELFPPPVTPRFGGPIPVGHKGDFPAALPQACILGTAGVFYCDEARSYLVHLSAGTEFLLSDGALADTLTADSIRRDSDGSYWLALFNVCTHLGAALAYRNDCRSFKCPSHGAHFHCDGEYLDGPAVRSMDRFPIRFDGTSVIVETGQINQSVERPDVGTRLLAPPTMVCEDE
jgi:cytochrome b6-f complex iron-sulfur subunit